MGEREAGKTVLGEPGCERIIKKRGMDWPGGVWAGAFGEVVWIDAWMRNPLFPLPFPQSSHFLSAPSTILLAFAKEGGVLFKLGPASSRDR